MIDFTYCKPKNKCYAGANGGKKCVVYNGEQYMIKFPPHPSKNQEMSYSNSCISEYIGCHIFEMIGIPAQKTLLGYYEIDGRKKIVCPSNEISRLRYRFARNDRIE